jgi:hypothetical protein
MLVVRLASFACVPRKEGKIQVATRFALTIANSIRGIGATTSRETRRANNRAKPTISVPLPCCGVATKQIEVFAKRISLLKKESLLKKQSF